MKNAVMNCLEDYKKCLENEEKSPATVEKYMKVIRTFFYFLGNHQITKTWTCAYKHYLEQKGYATMTINAMLAAINRFVCLFEMEECAVKTLRVQKQMYRDETQELTKAEYYALLKAAKGKPYLQMIIETLAGTGIRISELKYFTVEAIREGKIDVKCKNKIRTILVSGKLRKKLLNYAKKSIFMRVKSLLRAMGKVWTAAISGKR